MSYIVELTNTADRQFEKLDHKQRRPSPDALPLLPTEGYFCSGDSVLQLLEALAGYLYHSHPQRVLLSNTCVIQEGYLLTSP